MPHINNMKVYCYVILLVLQYKWVCVCVYTAIVFNVLPFKCMSKVEFFVEKFLRKKIFHLTLVLFSFSSFGIPFHFHSCSFFPPLHVDTLLALAGCMCIFRYFTAIFFSYFNVISSVLL